MARKRYTAAELKELARKAELREEAMLARRLAAPKPYVARPSRQPVVYKSILLDDVHFDIDMVSQNANALLSGTPTNTLVPDTALANLGLLANAPSGKSSTAMRGTGRKPCMAMWFNGDSTPRVDVLPWGTRSVKWGDKTGTGTDAQSHRSCPVGDIAGVASFEGVRLLVEGLVSANRLAILNTKGKFTLVPEQGRTKI